MIPSTSRGAKRPVKTESFEGKAVYESKVPLPGFSEVQTKDGKGEKTVWIRPVNDIGVTSRSILQSSEVKDKEINLDGTVTDVPEQPPPPITRAKLKEPFKRGYAKVAQKKERKARRRDDIEAVPIPNDFCSGIEYDSERQIIRQERRDRAKGVGRRRRRLHLEKAGCVKDSLNKLLDERRIPIMEDFIQLMIRKGEEMTRDGTVDNPTEEQQAAFREYIEEGLSKMLSKYGMNFTKLDSWENLSDDEELEEEEEDTEELERVLAGDFDEDPSKFFKSKKFQVPTASYMYETFQIGGTTAKRWMINIVTSYNCECITDLVSFAFNVKGATFEPDLFPGLRWKIPDSNASISLFANGWMNCAGGRVFTENAKATALVIRLMERFNKHKPKRDKQLLIDSITFGFEFSFAIRLSKFANSDPQFTRYQPEKFPALFYYMTKPEKCTWVVFANGRCVVTGLKSLENSVSAAEAFVEKAMTFKF